MGSKPSKLSASRVSAILGINPWKTELELWYEIMDEEYPGWLKDNGYNWAQKDISDKPAIRLGNLFEDSILDFIGGDEVCDRERFYSDEVLSCHIDARVDGGLIEAKTTNLFTFWADWGPGDELIPDYYYCQTQVQMGLSGELQTAVPVLVFPSRQTTEMCDTLELLSKSKLDDMVAYMASLGLLKKYTINFDRQIFEKIKNTAEQWWQGYIVSQTPPLEHLTHDKIVLPVFGEVEPTEDICEAIAFYKSKEKESKQKKDEAKEAKDAILKYMIKHAETCRSDFVRIRKGDRVLATYNGKSGRFSIKGEKEC